MARAPGPNLDGEGPVDPWPRIEPRRWPRVFRSCARALPVLVITMLMTLVGVGPVNAGASAQSWTLSPADEATYVANINAIRAANGLNALTLDANMTGAARSWTTWMVENDTLAHADDIVSGAPSDWLKVGENVGRGGSIDSVWQAFLNSPSHAANVLDPAYDFVGIGVIWNADGRMYTTHRFASTESAQSGGSANPVPTTEPDAPAEPDDQSPQEPLTAPVTPTPEPSDAVPEQLPFKADSPVLAPPAEPARIAATMALLLAAG